MNPSFSSFTSRTAVAVLFGIAAAVATPQTTKAASLWDFNSSNQLADSFYTAPTSQFSSSSSGGISDTGWLTTSTGTGSSARASVVTNDTFAGNTASFTLSLDFKWQTSSLTSGDLLVLGFGTSTDSDVRFDPVFGANGATVGPASAQEFHLGLGATAASNVVRISGSVMNDGVIENFTSGSSNTTLVSGNWYKLSISFTLNSAEDGYLATATLLNSSATGEAGTHLLSWSTSKVNSALVNHDVHAFIASRNAPYSGVTGIDNFAVSAMIPEASTVTTGLIGLGMLGFAFRRKGLFLKSNE